jgi:hypothetical protein
MKLLREGVGQESAVARGSSRLHSIATSFGTRSKLQSEFLLKEVIVCLKAPCHDLRAEWAFATRKVTSGKELRRQSSAYDTTSIVTTIRLLYPWAMSSCNRRQVNHVRSRHTLSGLVSVNVQDEVGSRLGLCTELPHDIAGTCARHPPGPDGKGFGASRDKSIPAASGACMTLVRIL